MPVSESQPETDDPWGQPRNGREHTRNSNDLFTRGSLGRLSTAGFAGMPATALSPGYLYHVIAYNKIELPMERHLDGHVREERP